MQPDTALSVEQFLALLGPVKRSGDNWQAKCPAHEDHRESLSVGIGRNGAIVVRCHAGCPFEAILSALTISPAQLFPPAAPKLDPFFKAQIDCTYDYKDADGKLLYQVCRLKPKDFRQRQPDPVQPGRWIWKMNGVTRIPYRLYELAGHETVYLVEGEKDADALWAIGLPATTNVGGAGKWRDSDSACLKTIGVKRLVLLPDNDSAGKKHTDSVARSVKALGLAVLQITLPNLPPKGDVSNWLAAGGRRDELQQMVSKQPWVVPKGSTTAAAPDDPDTIAAQLAELRKWKAVGQAELFAAHAGAEFRYNHARKTWLHYEAPCWRPDATMAIFRAVSEFVRHEQREALNAHDSKDLAAAAQAESPAALKNLVDAATWNHVFADTGENWDNDPWAIAVENGVIDLHTGLLRPGLPADRITMKCTVPYIKDAPCPRWWQFLAEIFDGDVELVEFIQRLTGYCLTGITTERVVPMLYGRGANGKSVFLNVIAALLGDYAFTLPFSSLQYQKQEGIPNDLAALVGRRFVTMIEANEGLRLNEAKIKTLSGNDRISARFLHGEFFTFQPVAKFVLAMNHKPITKDDSPAFWERIRLVPFLHTFPVESRDETLQQRLIETEGSGILAWAVEGCLAWQKGGLTKPESIQKATADYRIDSDQLAEFLASCANDDQNAVTGASDVQKAYSAWADSRGLNRFERLSSQTVGRLLAERYERGHAKSGWFYKGLEVVVKQLF